MKTLNIFIASSYELSAQRIQIGDFIRKLSYDYSPRGVRLCLACWEDFHPEYSGTSKQQEYDEQLIKTCDIFIALFRTRCGFYTQHEIKLALSLNKESHIIQLPSTQEHDDLDKYLSTINLTPQQCEDSKLIVEVEKIINNYLIANNISLLSVATPLNTWRLYATIPDDLEDLKVPFSNTVRGLEKILEETFGGYFTLHPYHTPANIASTDHYLCFMKDCWNQDDEEEVRIAYEACKSVNIPETALLYQVEGHSGETNNLLAIKINSEYEGFSKTYSHIDTIKYDLVNWALRHKLNVSLDAVRTFSVEGDMIYCYGRPFFNLTMYPELRTSITYITNSIAKIEEKIRKNMKGGTVKDENTAIDLAKKRKHKEAELQSTINNWYNKTQLLESLQFHTGVSPVETLKLNQFTQYVELSEQIKCQTKQCKNADDLFLKDFASKLLEWEDAANKNLSMSTISIFDYIQVLTHIIRVCDTYFHSPIIHFDEYAIFKKVIDAADKYNYHTLFTEVMRVNYANSFKDDLQHDITGEYYRNACEYILDIEDDSVMAHRYKSYVIKSLLNYYFEIDDKQAVFNLGKQYEDLIHQWQQINTHTNYDVDLARCYSFILAAAPKYYGVCKDLAEKSEDLIDRLHKQFDSRPFDEDYFDAICYFNIVLSAYFIDRYEYGNDVYFDKATQYIKESQKSLQARYPYDPLYIQQSLSQPLHNRGFLLSKVHNWKSAISNYKSALKKREALYSRFLSDKALLEIAQTSVNLGDAYRNIKKFDKASECAEKAMAIYESKRVKEVPVFDMYYYEAYQLKATILMDIDKEEGNYPHVALKMMQECMDWSNNHPHNDYADRFEGVSGIILNTYNYGR